MKTPRILIVDDDPDIRGLLRDYLSVESYSICEAEDGPGAVAACREMAPDLVVLDVMMPGYDGMEACRRIRRFSAVPVIFLTGRADEVDQLLGFELGADDYVTKPFSPRALVARVKAMLRRSAVPADAGSEGTVRYGDFEIHLSAFTVKRAGEEIDLTAKEFQLLAYFVRHPGSVLTKRQLITGAWGEEYLGDDAALMVHLSHLRQKLGEAGIVIKTVRGVGYKFIPDAEAGS